MEYLLNSEAIGENGQAIDFPLLMVSTAGDADIFIITGGSVDSYEGTRLLSAASNPVGEYHKKWANLEPYNGSLSMSNS